jgi:hypothetical protein
MQGVAGYVLMDRGVVEDRFVSEILANGIPAHPVIYWTHDPDEAKSWKTARGAESAADRVGEVEIVQYRTEDGRRRLIGTYVPGFGLMETGIMRKR